MISPPRDETGYGTDIGHRHVGLVIYLCIRTKPTSPVGVQEFVQGVLEEEVTLFLGRRKSKRRSPIDSGLGYRNGYRRPRRLTLSTGTIEVRGKTEGRVRNQPPTLSFALTPVAVQRREFTRFTSPQETPRASWCFRTASSSGPSRRQ